MDLFKLRRKQEIGEKAKRLLENEILNKWWEVREASLIRQLKNATPNTEEVNYVKASLDALEDMKKDFNRYVSEGNHAAEEAKKQSR